MSDYISSQLEQLSAKVAAQQAMGPNDAKSQNVKRLYSELVAARAAASPDNVSEAERNYYTEVEGVNGPMYARKLANKAALEEQKIMASYTARMASIREKLDTLASLTTYAASYDAMYLSKLNAVILALKNSQMADDSVRLNERKSYYMDQELQTITSWSIVADCLVVAVAATHLRNIVVFRQFKDPVKWLILGGILCVLGVTPALMYLSSIFSPPTNVYTEFDDSLSGTKI